MSVTIIYKIKYTQNSGILYRAKHVWEVLFNKHLLWCLNMFRLQQAFSFNQEIKVRRRMTAVQQVNKCRSNSVYIIKVTILLKKKYAVIKIHQTGVPWWSVQAWSTILFVRHRRDSLQSETQYFKSKQGQFFKNKQRVAYLVQNHPKRHTLSHNERLVINVCKHGHHHLHGKLHEFQIPNKEPTQPILT